MNYLIKYVTFADKVFHEVSYILQMKESPWEGGVRGVAALWSPLLHSTQRVSNQLMHIADWLPTFYSAAGTLNH